MRSEKKNSLLFGAFWLTFSAICVKIFGVFYRIPLFYYLGDEGMGYFNTGYTVFSVLYILCASGIPKAITIVISENKENENKAISSSLICFGIFGGVISVLLAVFASPIARAIGVSKSAECILMISPAVFLCAISGVLRGVLIAKGKLDKLALSEMLSGGVKLGSGLLLAKLFVTRSGNLAHGAAGAVLGLTFGAVVSAIFLGIVYLRSSRSVTLENGFDGNILRKIVKTALPITAGGLLMSFCNVCDMFLIQRKFQGNGASEQMAASIFGNYSALCVPMFGLAASVITAICTATLSKLTDSANRSEDLQSESIRSAVDLLSFCSVLFSVGFFCFPQRILCLLFSEDSAAIAAPALRTLASSVVFLALSSMVNTASESRGDTKMPFIGMAVGAIFKFFVALILIGIPQYGILGAPIGTTVFYAVSFAFVLLKKQDTRKLGLRMVSEVGFLICIALISAKTAMSLQPKFGAWAYDFQTVLLGTVYVLTFALLTLGISKISKIRHTFMQPVQTKL